MSFSTGTRKVGVRVSLALALGAALALLCGADPEPVPSTISAPPVVTEVGSKTLSQWIADLKHADPSVREEAVRAIVLFGPAASAAVPQLVDRLQDSDASPRSKAVIALGMIRIDEKDRSHVVDAVGTRLMDDSQAMVRYDAAVTLAELGPDSKGALPAILHGVEDPSSWEIRRVAIEALVVAGQTPLGPDVRATHALLVALTDRAAQVRLEAVMALCNMGRPADAAMLARVVSSLKTTTGDKDKTVVIWAHVGIMGMEKVDEANMAFLVKCVEPAESEKVRIHAIHALGAVGTRSGVVVPALIRLLADDSAAVQINACLALGGLGKDAPAEVDKALTDLSQAKDAKEAVKATAQAALDALKIARMK